MSSNGTNKYHRYQSYRPSGIESGEGLQPRENSLGSFHQSRTRGRFRTSERTGSYGRRSPIGRGRRGRIHGYGHSRGMEQMPPPSRGFEYESGNASMDLESNLHTETPTKKDQHSPFFSPRRRSRSNSRSFVAASVSPSDQSRPRSKQMNHSTNSTQTNSSQMNHQHSSQHREYSYPQYTSSNRSFSPPLSVSAHSRSSRWQYTSDESLYPPEYDAYYPHNDSLHYTTPQRRHRPHLQSSTTASSSGNLQYRRFERRSQWCRREQVIPVQSQRRLHPPSKEYNNQKEDRRPVVTPIDRFVSPTSKEPHEQQKPVQDQPEPKQATPPPEQKPEEKPQQLQSEQEPQTQPPAPKISFKPFAINTNTRKKRPGDGMPEERPQKEPKLYSTPAAPPIIIPEPRAQTPVPPEKKPPMAYERIGLVGEGTYGKVYKAQNTLSREIVALKRIRMEAERDGFPITALREIKLLQSLHHPNVVSLLEIMVEKSNVYMVFDYMDHDLAGILTHPEFKFTAPNLKHLSRQLLEGLDYLHSRGVLHRDIKGSNILLNNQGVLKLADFGLARFYNTKRSKLDYTNRVITLWYRPPELLLGATVYGPSIDVWSTGCIMIELFTRKPAFPGQDEVHQLELVYELLGTPNPRNWPFVDQLPWYELVKPKVEHPSRFVETFASQMTPEALDLCQKLLTLDPEQRPSAAQALSHPYFTSEEPAPEAPTNLGLGDWHEYESKQHKRKEREREKRARKELQVKPVSS